jgi:hypothetical protein
MLVKAVLPMPWSKSEKWYWIVSVSNIAKDGLFSKFYILKEYYCLSSKLAHLTIVIFKLPEVGPDEKNVNCFYYLIFFFMFSVAERYLKSIRR